MAHYCHFWYKLGGCTCNSWVLDSRVQVTRGNKFARVRVLLLELKYSQVGIGTGYPGVFQGYPYPYPRKPVPVFKGTGFEGYGYGWGGRCLVVIRIIVIK